MQMQMQMLALLTRMPVQMSLHLHQRNHSHQCLARSQCHQEPRRQSGWRMSCHYCPLLAPRHSLCHRRRRRLCSMVRGLLTSLV